MGMGLWKGGTVYIQNANIENMEIEHCRTWEWNTVHRIWEWDTSNSHYCPKLSRIHIK